MNRHWLFVLIIILSLFLSGCTDGPLDNDDNGINSDVSALLYDEDSNQLFIGTEDNGFFIYYPYEDRWIHRSKKDGLPSNHVYSMAFDKESNLLFLGTLGLTIYNIGKNTFINLDENDGLQYDDIYSLSYNPTQDELYIGYRTSGFSIYHVTDETLMSYDTSNTEGLGDGLPHDSNDAITYDEQTNNVIIGALRFISIFNLDNESFSNYNASDDSLTGLDYALSGLASIQFFAKDSHNRMLYIGTSANGAWSFNLDNNKFENLNVTDFSVPALALDSNSQTLYIGSGRLIILDLTSNSIIERTTEHGIPAEIVQALALDPDSNTLYIGTNNGPGLTVYDIDNDSFRTIE